MVQWSETEQFGWGRYPRVTTKATRAEGVHDIQRALNDRAGQSVIAFGNGRSYGDAALIRDGRSILMRRLNRLLEFDYQTGWLKCEAGVTLRDLIATFVPRGFFPPVVPGTQLVTVGGAVANDIHGKNHHVDGTFSDHVRRMEILTASGEIVACGPELESELFWATVGGLGLTGLILTVEFKLLPIASPFIEMESIRVENLDEFFEINAESSDFTHTVSWIDSVTTGAALGRGIFMRGKHAPADAPVSSGLMSKITAAVGPLLNVPFDAPNWAMNQLSMKLFNFAYFRKHPKGKRETRTHYEPFFFPLDAIANWNRIYGPRGMLQYQLVVPNEPDHRTIRTVLSTVTDAGMASFLTVIKEFGPTVHGGLSFPQPGITLALDFPNHGAPLFELLNRLDDIVCDAGGRVYLGKDARLSPEHFRRMYPDWGTWKSVRDRWDPDEIFQSELSRRLGLSGGEP
ncbi:MAG: FAD-binding oxidoreductase [Myxococcota bacterium]|nr:FAD-binding oxidoreductase [Myxococcota bacterium]